MARPAGRCSPAPCALRTLLDEARAARRARGAGAPRRTCASGSTCRGRRDGRARPPADAARARQPAHERARVARRARRDRAVRRGSSPTADGAPSLVLAVRDTGRGMSEEFIRTSLFRPFATTKAAGLGVGLAPVPQHRRGARRHHHGREPARARAPRSRCTLPAGAAAESQRGPEARMSREKILIVDDEESIRNQLTLGARRRVRGARPPPRADEARRLLREEQPERGDARRRR